MFYGEFEHTLDPKGRLIIPSKFRSGIMQSATEKLFITRGLDGCLFVFTAQEWAIQEKRFRQMSFTHQQTRQFNRLFFSGAYDVYCDKQGRILLPQSLKTYAKIQDKVMVVGVSNRFEIWSQDTWKTYVNDAVGSFEEIAEQLFVDNKDTEQ